MPLTGEPPLYNNHIFEYIDKDSTVARLCGTLVCVCVTHTHIHECLYQYGLYPYRTRIVTKSRKSPNFRYHELCTRYLSGWVMHRARLRHLALSLSIVILIAPFVTKRDIDMCRGLSIQAAPYLNRFGCFANLFRSISSLWPESIY
jgi:hypothetical protein